MTRSLRICLADDDADSRAMMRKLLESLGHCVQCTVSDGQKLVEVANDLELDLAIVDLEMPVLDGLAAAEEIWNSWHIPLILVSGHSDFNNIVRDKEPISTYLTKPVLLDSLKRAIDKAVGDRQGSGAKPK